MKIITNKNSPTSTSNENHSRSKTKRKKRKYIPGLAQLNFTVPYDWSHVEAQHLYKLQKKNWAYDFPLDSIEYKECIKGMQNLPAQSMDLILADPPFGIDFSGKEQMYNRKAAFVAEDYHEIEDDYGQFS